MGAWIHVFKIKEDFIVLYITKGFPPTFISYSHHYSLTARPLKAATGPPGNGMKLQPSLTRVKTPRQIPLKGSHLLLSPNLEYGEGWEEKETDGEKEGDNNPHGRW